LLIQPRSPEILAQSIKTLYDDEALTKNLSQEARLTVENKFNPKITSAKLEDLYCKLGNRLTTK